MTHQIRMTGGSRFLPAETIARAGDTLRFINRTGGPHNVQFDGDSIPGPSRLLLVCFPHAAQMRGALVIRVA